MTKTHQLSRSSEYSTWCMMKARCNNPKEKRYPYYGARGISVCTEWNESFEVFLRDMGKKPTRSHTLDRIDNSGNYEPSNCRWATKLQQTLNRRLPSRNKSGYRGVSAKYGHWVAQIGWSGNKLSLGYFESPEEAALAYDVAAIQVFGDDAQLNLLGIELKSQLSTERKT